MTLRSAKSLQDRLGELAGPICRAHGVDLVEITFVRGPTGALVKVLIERIVEGAPLGASNVTIEDCANVHRDLATALDLAGDVPGEYGIEVGSPGVDRPLVKPADFEKYAGQEIKLATQAPLPFGEGTRRRFQGKLHGFREGHVEMDQDGTLVRIPFAEITKCNLVFRWDTKSPRKTGARA